MLVVDGFCFVVCGKNMFLSFSGYDDILERIVLNF